MSIASGKSSKTPEMQTVVSQHGRPDDGTDATGFFNAEFFVPLKPFDTSPSGMDKQKVTDELSKRFAAEFQHRLISHSISKTMSKKPPRE